MYNGCLLAEVPRHTAEPTPANSTRNCVMELMSLHVTRDYVAACCSALQRVAVRCSVLQCVVTCCSVLQDLRDKSDDNRSVVIFRNKK